MPDCIICYESDAIPFTPETRPKSCTCKYDIHNRCYTQWLNSNEDLAFHCVICRKTMTNDEVKAANPDWERTLRYAFASFFIVINFYKQLIALAIFLALVLYIKKVIEVQMQRMRR